MSFKEEPNSLTNPKQIFTESTSLPKSNRIHPKLHNEKDPKTQKKKKKPQMITDSQIKKRKQFPKTDILLKLPYSPKSHSIPPKLHNWGRPQNPENLQHHNPQKKTDSQIKQEPNFQKTNILLNLPYSTKSDPARSTKITQLGETQNPKHLQHQNPQNQTRAQFPLAVLCF